MKNEENKVFSDTQKTVLFTHSAVRFVIDWKMKSIIL